MRRARTGALAAALPASLVGLLVRPDVARACTVCFGGGNDDWNAGFLFGTILMLALPPAVVIGAGIAIYRAMKRQEARLQERDARRAAVPTARS